MQRALTAFERPVTIFVGLGFPRRVDDAAQAFELLADLPLHLRGTAHAAALQACRAAIAGDLESEAARVAVEAFASARGLLVPHDMAESVLRARDELMAA